MEYDYLNAELVDEKIADELAITFDEIIKKYGIEKYEFASAGSYIFKSVMQSNSNLKKFLDDFIYDIVQEHEQDLLSRMH